MVPSVNVFNMTKMVFNERASCCSIVESYGSSLIWPTVVLPPSRFISLARISRLLF
jgi:hypothetical protein